VRLARLIARDLDTAARFAPPAEPGAVADLVAEFGLEAPGALRALYAAADGSVGCESPSVARYVLDDDGLFLLSLAEVRRQKRSWDSLALVYGELKPAARAKVAHHALWSTTWLPLAVSVAGDVYALATTPSFGGPAHQIVRFNAKGARCWEVVSPSLDEFLDLLATLLERRERALPSWALAQLSPHARRVALRPVTANRFERAGVPLTRVARPPPPPPPLGVLVRRAADERGVEASALVERVLEAARRALPAVFGDGRRVEVSFDEEAGELRLWCVAIAVERVERPGLELDAYATGAVYGPCDVGDELLFDTGFRDDPTARSIADEQAKTFGALLAWGDEWARSLETWRALYRTIVADALRET
jgi:cell wall assembly regulator SMI1